MPDVHRLSVAVSKVILNQTFTNLDSGTLCGTTSLHVPFSKLPFISINLKLFIVFRQTDSGKVAVKFWKKHIDEDRGRKTQAHF